MLERKCKKDYFTNTDSLDRKKLLSNYLNEENSFH